MIITETKMKKYTQRMLSSYEARMRNNNIGLNMVLYCNNYIYEYNPDTYEIRPFNSLVWYYIDNDIYDHILTELRNDYNTVLFAHNKNTPILEYGYISNNTVVINLEEMQNAFLPKRTMEELNCLLSKLKSLYDQWKNIALFMANQYTPLDGVLGTERID